MENLSQDTAVGQVFLTEPLFDNFVKTHDYGYAGKLIKFFDSCQYVGKKECRAELSRQTGTYDGIYASYEEYSFTDFFVKPADLDGKKETALKLQEELRSFLCKEYDKPGSGNPYSTALEKVLVKEAINQARSIKHCEE